MTTSPLSSVTPPIFGEVPDNAPPPPTRTFGLQVSYRARGQLVRESVMLTAYVNMDAGAMLRLMQAGDDELRLASATAFVLATALVDDDGVPADWTLPSLDEPAPADEDDPDGEPARGEPTVEEPDGVLLYERWDGELVPYDDLEFDEWEDGSSRRRFSWIMASSRYRVELPALNGVARWLIEQGGGRPTKRPASSGRGPSSTRHGYAGRRH